MGFIVQPKKNISVLKRKKIDYNFISEVIYKMEKGKSKKVDKGNQCTILIVSLE